MRTWFVLSILMVIVAIGTLGATGQDAKQLAAKGHEVFVEVLGGHEAKYAEAVKYMEDARQLDPANTNNLYNLARAYFYDALTTNNAESAKKAGTAQQSQSAGQGRQQGASSEAESRKPDDKAKKSR